MVSILLIAEAEDSIQQSIIRALMLARYLRARLDILFCRMEHGGRSHAHAHAYLDSLRNSVAAPDVEITTEASFEGPLHEQVADKARAAGSRIIVKSTERIGRARETRIQWPLLQHAPVPVLFTQGRVWNPRPCFAAIEGMGASAPMLAWLSEACGAQLRRLPAHAELEQLDADQDIDLLAVLVSTDPNPPPILQRLIASRHFLTGCDLLFVRD